MIVALIPAAGQSRRMGRCKAALPWGAGTVLDHLVSTCRGAGIERVLVVIAPHTAELGPIAERAGAELYCLPEATPDMRATVEAGLAWLQAREALGNEDSWLLVPSDHAPLSVEIITTLLVAAAADPERVIFVPSWCGRRGHPTLFRWSCAGALKRFTPGLGIDAFIRSQADAVCEVPSGDAAVCLTMNTPADYERLLQRSKEAQRHAASNFGGEAIEQRGAHSR